MTTIRWGIIGCGDVTEVKSGPGFQKARGSALVAVMRRDASKAADYARRHGVPQWYNDADKLIADSQVNAIYIATPPGTHEMYAMKVCAAGKPCYVEKPMTRNAAEAQRMVDAFAAARLPLFVAYYRRRLPRFLKAKEIIDGRMLGRLQSFSYHYADPQMLKKINPVPWRLQAEHAGAGLFLDLGSHALDVLDYLLDPLGEVRGEAINISGNYQVEDHIALTFKSTNGASGAAEFNFASPVSADEFVFKGDRAELRFPCFARGPVVIQYTNGIREEFDPPSPPHVAQPLIQTIVDDLLHTPGIPKCPSTGISGLRTQTVMDQALQSYYGSRDDGFWRKPWPKNR